MKENKSDLWQSDLIWQAIKDSVPKLDPRRLWRNPVMFAVELGGILLEGKHLAGGSFEAHGPIGRYQTVDAIAAPANGGKPLLLVFLGESNGRRRDQGLPEYSTPEWAVAALNAMHEYQLWRNRPELVVTRFLVNRRRVERVITRHIRA